MTKLAQLQKSIVRIQKKLARLSRLLTGGVVGYLGQTGRVLCPTCARKMENVDLESGTWTPISTGERHSTDKCDACKKPLSG